MEDREIISLFYERDEKAIAESSEKYGAYCFSVANNILQSEQDAEECVSDTWLRAWNAIPPEKPNSLRLFFAKITRNLAFNRYKAQNRQKRGGGVITVALEEISEFLPTAERIEQAVAEEELMQSVNRFLRSVSARERGIFIRRYFYVESAKEIANRYALTEGNVQKILFRTREKLKQYLEEEGYKV